MKGGDLLISLSLQASNARLPHDCWSVLVTPPAFAPNRIGPKYGPATSSLLGLIKATDNMQMHQTGSLPNGAVSLLFTICHRQAQATPVFNSTHLGALLSGREARKRQRHFHCELGQVHCRQCGQMTWLKLLTILGVPCRCPTDGRTFSATGPFETSSARDRKGEQGSALVIHVVAPGA